MPRDCEREVADLRRRASERRDEASTLLDQAEHFEAVAEDLSDECQPAQEAG